MNNDAKISHMSEELIVNILNALGLQSTKGWRWLLRLACHKATLNLAAIGLAFDRLIEEAGLRRAAAWALQHWCRGIRVLGSENIPSNGPLLVISNHPGAYDALVIASQIPRQDLHFIASDLAFLRNLDNFCRRTFFIPMDINDATRRMAGMLSAVRLLKNGGSVLLMGSGTIDPDPAVYPGASNNLQRWTEAASLFLRFVPEAQVILSAVSHVLTRDWAYHPLTWLRKGMLEKRRLAEFGQVLQQLFRPGSLYVSPCLSFSPILTSAQLGDSPRSALLEFERFLLQSHCQIFGGRL